MITRLKWTERRFDFSFPQGLYPNILERLRGTPARVEEMTRDLPEDTLTQYEPGSWSIQQHIGHLIDLEVLHEGRIDDFIAGAPGLRPADMTNKMTNEASHNSKPLHSMLEKLRATRSHFTDRLESLDDEVIKRVSMHPRLNQPMRVVDMMFFVAEHDDHHLAIMREIMRR